MGGILTMERNIEVYNNLNEMFDIYGKYSLTPKELVEKGITNILIKSEGYYFFGIWF